MWKKLSEEEKRIKGKAPSGNRWKDKGSYQNSIVLYDEG
ncbi:hypothetical protein OCHUTO_0633 [Orientia chuto str. Dubai]|uniref:Uncharacterized protein n=1 Tax=Orientia chuto str. Dubai TaxID=1359168 RepID=A0A0F3MKM7_9RICK|nr:hypothetical protein OCHUTO_0633 [Orientia chuto str. Dubai]